MISIDDAPVENDDKEDNFQPEEDDQHIDNAQQIINDQTLDDDDFKKSNNRYFFISYICYFLKYFIKIIF